jgi:hypothetical protein
LVGAQRLAAEWLGLDETDIAAGFRRLCARGTRVMLVCGENDGSRDVVRNHLGPDARRFSGNRNFRFVIIEDTDHTFSPLRARHELTERLTSFLANEPAPTSVPLISSRLRSALSR